jgi:chromosome segregation ATPase
LQALDLSKAHVRSRVMVVAQGTRTAELEAENAKLQSELEQARQVLAEADAAWSLLCASRDELEWECTKLDTGVDTLKREKTQFMTDREADVVAE